MKGLLISIEGTDCSGKQTQTNLLKDKLNSLGYKVSAFSFPFYDSPTGKIIAGPYLAKFGEGYFKESASHVPAKVASLYFAADRAYNASKIEKALEENDIVLLDRYIYSNMAHQASKEANKEKRDETISFLKELEFNLLKLRKPDIVIFLHMPTEIAKSLKAQREEKPDQHEQDEEYLKRSEQVYLQMANSENFITIKCYDNNQVKSIDDISKEVIATVINLLEKK